VGHIRCADGKGLLPLRLNFSCVLISNKFASTPQELPELLLPMSRAKLVPPPAANVDAAALARYFRKGYFQSFRRLASGRYMGPIARQLNGRIGLFNALGRHATWYIPAVIGLFNVFDAAPEVRMHTLFEEGFGVVGGALGTLFGSAVVASSVLGIFTIVGLCHGSQLDYGQIYHSFDQLIEAF
jgi:hypothetical protein